MRGALSYLGSARSSRSAASSRAARAGRAPRRWAALCLGLLAFPAAAGAQAPVQVAAAAEPPQVAALRQELETLKQSYEQRLSALEKRLAELEAARAASPAAPSAEQPAPAAAPAATAQAATAPEAPAAAAPVAAPAEAPIAPGAPSQTSNYFNPSVSVIGNFLGVGGQNRVAPLPGAELRESELGLQAIVDPYARADFFISFGEHDVNVEEGFVTLTSLPAGLLAKVGRMRVSFGKINTLHLHVLPWPDEPLTQVNLLGGEEGWVGTGVSLARLIPLPGDTFSELTAQVFRGDSGGLFQAPRRGDLSYNGHYRLFRDLTEATNLDFGVSYAYGPNATTLDAKTRLQGTDFTLRWKPLQTGSYRSASLRGEVIRSQRQQPGGTQTALGWFVSGEYQLAKRWFVGARVEAAEHADDAARRDTGQALTLTFWPSEFSQLRGELRHRHYSLKDSATELLLQVQFAIGAHGAHPF
ncbi:MAG TPA: hypothetical protein VHR45_08310 [Thermoanaerobaculia bacterium]|nr:hypothetical protein [Thermoanaerobaculia bacterium]